MDKLDQATKISIDMIEALPTPYGLVRNGVAPDHPEVKNIQHDFDQLFEKQSTESHDPVHFYGNVRVGQDISLQELRDRYHVVVLAYGCDSDRSLPCLSGNEDHVEGVVFSAREFVAWYNGHVDYQHMGAKIQAALQSGPQNIVIVGQGNVALDCARILAKSYEEMRDSDITSSALDILAAPTDTSEGPRTIHVVGRRGHIQGAFTIKELRELTKLGHATLHIRPEELEMGLTEASREELKSLRPKVRIDKLLQGHSKKAVSESQQPTNIYLRFLCNPIGFEAADDGNVSRVICERTRLEGAPMEQQAVGTGEIEALDASLVLVSIGYKAVPIPETEQWYDEQQGVLINNHGVLEGPSRENGGGVYVSGWLKRGPSGIIGTNIADAKDTVASILHDMKSNELDTLAATSEQTSLQELLSSRGVSYVSWEAYRKIESKEADESRKRSSDQPREKILSREEQLTVANS